MELYDVWTIHLATNLLRERETAEIAELKSQLAVCAAIEEENKRLKAEIAVLVFKVDNLRKEMPKTWQHLHLQAHAEIDLLKAEIRRQEERYALTKWELSSLKKDYEWATKREVYG